MDHLPFPSDAEPLLIPYVATDWDQGDFATYPERCDMKADLKSCDFTSKTPEEYQSFFQTWLYVGLLSEVFKGVGMFLNLDPFLEDSDTGQYLFSDALNFYLDEWRYMAESSYREQESKNKIWKPIRKMLSVVREHLNRTLVKFQKFVDESSEADLPDWPLISLSIGALGFTLQEVCYRLYVAPKDWHQYQWGDYSLLHKRLQRSQWCKADIKRFMRDEALDFLLYVGAIKSPRRFENHEECTDVVCRGRMVNVDSYQQKHVRDDCTCHFINMPSAFAGIVDKGGIPLASWNGSEIELSVYNEKEKMPYVAISHVWSDGKGNDEANALYKCQLELIDEKIRMLYSSPRKSPSQGDPLFGPTQKRGFQDPWRKPVGFWMDTLCIPVREDQKILRKKSIAQMRDIYESADRVLVFDSLIAGLRRADGIYEKSLRLVISNWQHRLWTLQEGVLSTQTCFILQDGVITLDELKEQEGQKQKAESPGFFDRVTQGVQIVPVFNLSLFLDVESETPEQKRASNFTVLIPTINNRVTTRQEDETVCMATLLRIDTHQLQAISSPLTSRELRALPRVQREAEEQRVCDERMKFFLCQIQTFEANIIFNRLERIPSDGFRWAPRSFLGQSGSLITEIPGSDESSSGDTNGHILQSGNTDTDTDTNIIEGFIVEYPGIILNTPKFAQEPNTLFVKSGTQLFRAVLFPPAGAEDDDEELPEGQYAVIMGTIPKSQYGDEGVPSIFGRVRGTTTATASKTGGEGNGNGNGNGIGVGIRKVEHICLATTQVWDPPRNDDAVDVIAEDKIVDRDTKWCIM